MKKFIFTIALTVSLLVISTGLQAQNATPKLDQLKLMQQYIGTWQATIGKDTLEVNEVQQYGKVLIENVYRVIKGEKKPFYMNSVGFDPKQDKIKGFTLWRSGNTETWIGNFTTEKKFHVDFVKDFNPEMVTDKLEMLLETPTNMTMTFFNKDGAKTAEHKFYKVK